MINPPVVRVWEEKKRKKKAWKCTFVSPPDLWSQERDEWIQAVTENKKDIPVLNRLKLNNGDMCTVIGIQTGERDEPMAKGEKQTAYHLCESDRSHSGHPGDKHESECPATQSAAVVNSCRKRWSFMVKASKAQTMWGKLRFLSLLSP